VSEARSGLAAVTCTCELSTPAACAGEPLPESITIRRERTCALVEGAATARVHTLARRRLKRAIRSLKDSIRLLPRARREGLSDACAAALQADARDTKDRAERAMAPDAKPPAGNIEVPTRRGIGTTLSVSPLEVARRSR